MNMKDYMDIVRSAADEIFQNYDDPFEGAWQTAYQFFPYYPQQQDIINLSSSGCIDCAIAEMQELEMSFDDYWQHVAALAETIFRQDLMVELEDILTKHNKLTEAA